MTIRYNAKEAESESFDRLPPGTYLCEVEDAQEKESSTGSPMISLRWRYVEGGFTICWDNLVFSEKGRGIAHKKLKAMGYRIPGENTDVELEASDLIGLRSRLTLVEKEYQGKKNLTPDFNAEGFGYALVDDLPSIDKAKDGASAESKKSDKDFDEAIPF